MSIYENLYYMKHHSLIENPLICSGIVTRLINDFLLALYQNSFKQDPTRKYDVIVSIKEVMENLGKKANNKHAFLKNIHDLKDIYYDFGNGKKLYIYKEVKVENSVIYINYSREIITLITLV